MKRVFPLILILAILSGGTAPLTAQLGGGRGISLMIARPRPVKFARVEAFSDGRGAFVRWEMTVETDNVGFNVYRTSLRGDVVANEFMILGSKAREGADPVYGSEYSYFDPSGRPGDTYSVESVSAANVSTYSERTSAAYAWNIVEIAGQMGPQLSAMSQRRTTQFAAAEVVVPLELASEILSSTATADPDNQKVIASKPGVKLGIKTDGFYRVSRAQLAAGGFDVNSDPASWQLYCDGVQQAINVIGSGDQIEFLGRAKETIESDLRYYYLIAGDSAGLRMATRAMRGLGYSIASPNYRQTTYIKERFNYISDIINGDAENVWGRLVGTGGSNFTFTLDGVDPTAGAVNVVVKAQGFSTGVQSVGFILNGQTLPTANDTGAVPLSSSATIPASSLIEGSNTLNIKTLVSGDFILFDSISVEYSRRFLASQNQISFFTTNYRSAKVAGFSSPNIRLFDTTYDGQPAEIIGLRTSQDASGYSLDIPAYRSRKLFAVENGAAKSVAAVEANVPSTLSVPSHAADLVIITHPGFIIQANAWADYRRGQGFAVEVVDVRDIFDEFSYGQPSADSINAFLRYAYNSWTTQPRYALLIGDASYDAKNYEGLGYLNLVPTKFVSTVYTETGSDEALADFNGDGLAEMSIGRIPALTTQHAANALANVQAYELPAMQTLSRGALFAYDDPIGYDFAAMSNDLRGDLPVDTPSVMVGRSSPNAQTSLVNEMGTGKYLVNYSGHGTSTTWASTSFFSYLNVPSLTNANNRSIFTMLTCLNGYFVNPNSDSLAERLLKAQNGGAIVSWASSGKTTPDVQMVMAHRFYQQISLGNIKRVGDLIRDAKTEIVAGADVRYSWVLLGDPMLQVRQ